MKMPEQIETERLVLRMPHLDDGPAIFSGWAQDQEVTRLRRCPLKIYYSSKYQRRAA